MYSTEESRRDQSTPEEFGNISVKNPKTNKARICYRTHIRAYVTSTVADNPWDPRGIVENKTK